MENGNPGSGFRQAQKYGSVKLVNRIPSLYITLTSKSNNYGCLTSLLTIFQLWWSVL